MTYGESPAYAAMRAAYGDDNEENDNVRGILHLYAKWILDPDTSGYNIIYDAGDAALRDDLGNLLTTVPIDTHMYAFGDDNQPIAREAPSNYNELYKFSYWEAVDEATGDTVEIYPGNPIELSRLSPSDVIYDEETGEPVRKTITLRAVYTTDAAERLTHITYDGNTFTQDLYGGGAEELQGKANDGTQRTSITLSKEVNETITLPEAGSFYLDGYELVGWSFNKGSNQEKHFDLGQQVGADNLIQSELNTDANTLYAMWEPKKYTVTVKQIVENGVPVHTFAYNYKTGVEDAIESAQPQQQSLTNNSSFTVDDLGYYDLTGHVIHITTPNVPEDATYAVRVNAVVTHDDGTREILHPTADGDYRIYGNVEITYTYSPKVEVNLQKRDATNHSTVITDASFVLTPVEFSSLTQHWENAGDGTTITINQDTLTKHLQEGTYKIVEFGAPQGYATLSNELYLTITQDGEQPFRLFDASGQAINSQIAELDAATGRTLVIYDNPLRTVNLRKQVVGAAGSTESFTFTVTFFNNDGTRLGNYVVGNSGEGDVITNNIGEITAQLEDGGTISFNIPNGCKMTVTESENPRYRASYSWNNGSPVNARTFGETPVEITSNGTLVYINEISTVPVRIVKIDQEGNALEGGSFSLVGGDINQTGLSATIPTDASTTSAVIYENSQLPLGTYTLTEDSAPDGYLPLEGPVTIVVANSSNDVSVTASIDGQELLNSVSRPQGSDMWTVAIRNTAGAELPAAGGEGTVPLYALGLAMMIVPILYLRRRMSV